MTGALAQAGGTASPTASGLGQLGRAGAAEPLRLFLIAGEASGDRLGAALMEGLTQRLPAIRFDGIGGEAMIAAGLASRFAMDELSVMGLAEILPRYLHLKRRIRETAQAVIDSRADALITIDSPDFCLRVARILRARGRDLPIIHYVAPSVWAWRPGRAARMAPLVDHVLALLPFEPPFMHAAGISCDFVGHPVVAEARPSRAEADGWRAAKGIGADRLLVLALPGSRRGEIARLGPRFGVALSRLAERRGDVELVLPTLPHLREPLEQLTAAWNPRPLIVTEPAQRRLALAAADLALAASGTVSLELAANRVPMVIGYDMAPLSRVILRRLLRTDTVTLVNLVSDTRTVPEFLGRACTAEALSAALFELSTLPSFADAQRRAMETTMQRLGEGGPPPGLRAADSVIALLQRRAVIQPPPSTREPSAS